MKTIEQEVSERYDTFFFAPREREKIGFREGVQWAQEWISVTYELPTIRLIVLLKNQDNDYSTGRVKSDGFNPDFPLVGDITHWRPIELN